MFVLNTLCVTCFVTASVAVYEAAGNKKEKIRKSKKFVHNISLGPTLRVRRC